LTDSTPETLARDLRRHDRDRYLTTLFAPAERRSALIALYAFNFEVAKTREIVREPLLGRIRLQWWRESIDAIYRGAPLRQHEVMAPLAAAIRRHDLTRYHFDRLIDAREADLAEEPPADLAALERYAEDSAARLVRLALEILDARDAESAEAGRHVGIAWSLVGLIRALPVHAGLRRLSLPADLVAETGLDIARFLEAKPSPALSRIVERLATRAREQLVAARTRPAPAMTPSHPRWRGRTRWRAGDSPARRGAGVFERHLTQPRETSRATARDRRAPGGSSSACARRDWRA
jgi:NADH dehydrogenase [ubiquinone] 1 alpha subcomplex assembly factor 6